MLIFASMVAILLSAFSVFVYYSTVSIRKNAFYDRLWERTDIAFQMIHQYESLNLDSITPAFRNRYWTILPEEEIIVFDQHKEFRFINEFTELKIDYNSILENIEKDGKVEFFEGKRQMVGKIEFVHGEKYFVIISAFDRNGQRLLNNLKYTLLVSFLGSIILIIIAGWYFSKQSFKPVDKIIEITERINETDLHLRIPTHSGKNELTQLVNTINNSFDRLQNAFELQKAFVSNASHELRTPLTALIGDIEIALLKERTNEEYKQFLLTAFEDGKKLSKLVNQLLLLAKTASSTHQNSNFKPVRVDEIISNSLEQLLGVYQGRIVNFHFSNADIDDKQLTINGIENLLSIAFTNIIENALKYSSDLPIRIEITPSSAHLSTKIIDQGIGISLNDLNNIFVPFYRSKSNMHIEGIGIGLTLVKQIVEIHNGSITIKSKIGEGTTVEIVLPN